MTADEIKAVLREMPAPERRKVALFILELEKDRIKETVGPQVTEDLEAVAKLAQSAIERLKAIVKEGR